MPITIKPAFADGRRALTIPFHFGALFIWFCPSFVWFKLPAADKDRFFDFRILFFHFRFRKALRGRCPLCFCKEDGHWHYASKEDSFWKNRRWFIFLRHMALCFYCHELCPFEQGEVDHIVPRRLGGSDKLDNLRWVHAHCHDEFHDKERKLERLEGII